MNTLDEQLIDEFPAPAPELTINPLTDELIEWIESEIQRMQAIIKRTTS